MNSEWSLVHWLLKGSRPRQGLCSVLGLFFVLTCYCGDEYYRLSILKDNDDEDEKGHPREPCAVAQDVAEHVPKCTFKVQLDSRVNQTTSENDVEASEDH